MESPSIKPTSLSLGVTLKAVLDGSAVLKALGCAVAPLAVPAETPLPYIVYRRGDYSQRPVKDGRASETVEMLCLCAGTGYAQSVLMAEGVRQALEDTTVDGGSGYPGWRACTFNGATDAIDGEAFLQELSFTFLI